MLSRTSVIIVIIVVSVVALTKCMNGGEKASAVLENAEGEKFVGSATCAKCHKKIYESHVQTGHYLTSKPATENSIKGSFEKGKNYFEYYPGLVVTMEKRDSGLYQVAYSKGVEKVAKRFDIVIGSGTKGQTFLWWKENNLYQLPITYFTETDQWCNSPGFPDKVVFVRPVTSRCLECHTSFVKTISAPGIEPEAFDHNKILFGVDCEKCHGPAAAHVEYQTQHPEDTSSKYIVNPAQLSRQQNLDLCSLCHGGRMQKTKPSFEFTAGEKLSDYFVKNNADPQVNKMDVHGNQFGLLSQSKCFKMSSLTCESCHNSHENERGRVQVFSQRCVNCHDDKHEKFCKMKMDANILKSNCIDCHMPKQPSSAITVFLPGGSVPTAALIRTHFITTYPDETKKFLTGKQIEKHVN